MQTFKIELRVDYEDGDERLAQITEMCRASARELYTAAILLKDKREPRIVFESGDMFYRDKDLEIVNDDG